MRTFFADILVPKYFKPKTQLCNFWRQNICTKCVLKMLMKLTPKKKKESSRTPY